MILRLTSFFGIFVLVGLCWLASNNRKRINWKTVFWGLALQFVFAVLILKTTPGRWVFEVASNAVSGLISFTDRGAEFVWGPLYRGVPGNYGDKPVTYIYNTASGRHEPLGFVFLLNALMTIIFFSTLMSVGYHLGLVQPVISGMAKIMKRFMGTSGSETLSASANIFVGQTEAPLVVKPFIETMTMSELHAVMVGGFATVAGGVMAAYTTFGIDPGHLLAASVMSAPAALVAAKMFYPETEKSVTAGDVKIQLKKTTVNVFDAACSGASDGMKLVWNVMAMLLAFIALIALFDWCLGQVDLLIFETVFGGEAIGLSLGWIFGKLFFPLAFIMGIEWSDCEAMGALLGTRMAINEFVAYIELSQAEPNLNPRTFVLATYAFCGFANFSSIAIQIGGISGVAPSRKSDLGSIGLRAMLAGTMASLFTASLVGLLLSEEEVAFRHNARKADQFMGHHYQGKIDLFEKFSRDYPESSYLLEVDRKVADYREQAEQRFEELKKQLEIVRKKNLKGEIDRLLDEIKVIGTDECLKFVEGVEDEKGPPGD